MDRPKLIMVVEDEEDIREALSDTLNQQGYLVETAKNGQEALDKIERVGNPDLILLDLSMPIMDGYQLLNTIRGNPDRSLIPVVIMSAAANQSRVKKANDFLEKPFSLDLMLEMVRKHL